MKTLARFTDTVHRCIDELLKINREWLEHMESTTQQEEEFRALHPSELQDQWATLATVSAALHRLTTYDELLEHRITTVTSLGFPVTYGRFPRLLETSLCERPTGTETRAWQLIAAINTVQAYSKAIQQEVETREQQFTQFLGKLVTVANSLMDVVSLEEFAQECSIFEQLEELMHRMDELPDHGDADALSLKAEVEEMYERERISMQIRNGSIETSINRLQKGLAKLGVKMARQTMIEEYFDPSTA